MDGREAQGEQEAVLVRTQSVPERFAATRQWLAIDEEADT